MLGIDTCKKLASFLTGKSETINQKCREYIDFSGYKTLKFYLFVKPIQFVVQLSNAPDHNQSWALCLFREQCQFA